MAKNVINYIAIVLAVIALVISLSKSKGNGKKIAFVDTQRLLTAFKDAHLVNKEIKEEDEKMKENIKVMEDSLKAFMDRMSADFNTASLNKKKEYQDELSMRNQQINNYKHHQVKQIQKITDEKMAGVYSKINSLMKEYGDKHGYDIIFGTVQGNILYGTSTPGDITNEIIDELNKRYE